MPGSTAPVFAQSPYALGWGLNADAQASPVPTNVIAGCSSISAGYLHSLALKDQRVWGWGNNTHGQITVPTAAQSGVTGIAGGGVFSLALKNTGAVVAWGAGIVATNVPADAAAGVSQIAAGEWHALALKDGGVLAWGSNSYGQCNVPASLTSGVSAVAAGGHFSVALKDNGVEVFGIPATNPYAYSIRSVPPEATEGVSAIAAGRWHALALKDGGVLAWGTPFYDATNVPSEATSGVEAISAGDMFSVALKTDGTLVIWGDDTKGQVPVPAYAATGITQVAAGGGHILTLGPVTPPRFTGSILPDAIISNVYAGSVTAIAAPSPSYRKGSPFPAWLTLDPVTGALGGTPLETGNNIPFQVVASNSYGVVTNNFTLNVVNPLFPPGFITQSPLPNGEVGAPYELEFMASNTPHFSVVSGEGAGLPPGLTLSTNGWLTGTPTEAYNSFFQVRITNQAVNGVAVSNFFLTVNNPTNPPVFYTESPLPFGVVNEEYEVQIVVSNNPTISLLAGELPDGLMLSPDGWISGTPTHITQAVFTVQATNLVDASNRVYELQIFGPPVFITAGPLPDGVEGVPYSLQVEALGDPAYSVVAGSLPPGLDLSSGGLLDGTPTTLGEYNFTVRATNDFGWSNRVFDLVIGVVPAFSTASPLPFGVVAVPYSTTIEASGNPLFSVVSGSLPDGLDLAASGQLTGTPTTVENASFTVRATNAYGWADQAFALEIGAPPEFVTASPLPSGWLGVAYTNLLMADGADAFSLVAGNPPAGLTLAADGWITGTPSSAGTSNFTVRATNQFGFADRAFDLFISNITPPWFTAISGTGGVVRIEWMNPNGEVPVQVWRATNILSNPVTWSNLGVQTSPWTNTSPVTPSYFRLQIDP
jgi:hypothetical protein